MKKVITILFSLFLIVCIIDNLHSLNIVKNSFYEIYKAYYENVWIHFIYTAAIILDIFIIIVLLLENKFNRKLFVGLISSLSILFILNIAFEFFYSKTFYYGEISDKQGFPILMNNWGLVGIVLIIFLYLFFLRKKK